MSKQPPPAPTASAVGPCPTVIQIVGRPGPGRLSRPIGPNALAIGGAGGCLDIFLSHHFLFFLFLPLFGGRPDID